MVQQLRLDPTTDHVARVVRRQRPGGLGALGTVERGGEGFGGFGGSVGGLGASNGLGCVLVGVDSTVFGRMVWGIPIWESKLVCQSIMCSCLSNIGFTLSMVVLCFVCFLFWAAKSFRRRRGSTEVCGIHRSNRRNPTHATG